MLWDKQMLKNALSQFKEIPKGGYLEGGWRGNRGNPYQEGGEKKKLARECKAVSQIFLLFSKWARYNYLKYVHLTVTSKQYICVYACIYTILIAWVNILLSKIKEAHWISSLKAKVATN